MTDELRVGIIGVDAARGWARESHVPAVQLLGGLALVAVANRTQEAADAAAEAVGAERAYSDPAALIADPDLDVVTVAAPVPAHRALILAAFAAGKHVVTEWPVGTSTAQTEQITAAAAASGGHAAVGLQARRNPAVVKALSLVADGALGRVLSANVYSSTVGFGPRISPGELYLEDPASGMNLTTIQAAHTMDLVALLAGRLSSLAALSTVQYPDLQVDGAPGPHRRTVPDHVLLHARLEGGGALAVQVVGGKPADDTPFRLDVHGTRGVLTLTGGAPRGFQSGVLTLTLDGGPVEVDGGETGHLPDPVVNVAGVYAALRDDITSGTSTAPSFADAVRLSRLVDDIRAAALDGQTIHVASDQP